MAADIGAVWRVATVRLWEVTYHKPVDVPQATMAMWCLQRTLHSAGLVAAPGIVVRGGGRQPLRAWMSLATIGSAPSDSTLRRLLAAVVPWLGVADEPLEGGLPEIAATVGLVFTAHAAEETARIGSTGSVLWRMLGEAPHPWQLTVSSGAAEPDAAMVDLGLSLVGGGDDLAVVVPLLEADALFDEPVELRHGFIAGEQLAAVAASARSGRAPSVGLVPATIASRLLAIPFRVEGGWAVVDTTPQPAEAIVEAVRNAIPPHVLVQGGAGLGKTTLLDRLVGDSVAAGAAVMVVCPHGDLAARAAHRLVGMGVEVDGVDFGAPDPVHWNLTVPDEGVDPEDHASLLTAVVRGLWSDMDPGYFGPVWTRVFRAMMSVLVRDPAGPWPITRLPELMDPASSFREGALARIGDPSLHRVIILELMAMLQSKDPGNTAAWLVGKVDPLIGDSTVRAIVGSRLSTFDLTPVLDGRSMVVAVPGRRLTDDGARLLGSMILSRIWRLVQRRLPQRPIHVYVDEWQRLPVPDLGTMLAEGRKFGLSLRLANQNTAQIERRLWETATGNAGVVMSFRTGPGDAARLAPLYGDIGCDQLTRLADHWVALSNGSGDFMAPAPAPDSVGDGGDSMRTLHAAQVARSRRRLLAELARAMANHAARAPGPGPAATRHRPVTTRGRTGHGARRAGVNTGVQLGLEYG